MLHEQKYALKSCLSVGAFFCMLALIFSALTSHLPSIYFVQNGREISRIADNLLLVQGMALIILAILQKLWGTSVHFTIIAGMFMLGTVLFCSAVYYTAITGQHPSIPFAPMGGSLLIMGWGYLGIKGIFLQ